MHIMKNISPFLMSNTFIFMNDYSSIMPFFIIFILLHDFVKQCKLCNKQVYRYQTNQSGKIYTAYQTVQANLVLFIRISCIYDVALCQMVKLIFLFRNSLKMLKFMLNLQYLQRFAVFTLTGYFLFQFRYCHQSLTLYKPGQLRHQCNMLRYCTRHLLKLWICLYNKTYQRYIR